VGDLQISTTTRTYLKTKMGDGATLSLHPSTLKLRRCAIAFWVFIYTCHHGISNGTLSFINPL